MLLWAAISDLISVASLAACVVSSESRFRLFIFVNVRARRFDRVMRARWASVIGVVGVVVVFCGRFVGEGRGAVEFRAKRIYRVKWGRYVVK